jgi:ureidoglycolate hydrolase
MKRLLLIANSEAPSELLPHHPLGSSGFLPLFQWIYIMVFINLGLQGFRVTGIQGFRVTGFQGYRITGFQDFRVIGLQGFRVTGLTT